MAGIASSLKGEALRSQGTALACTEVPRKASSSPRPGQAPRRAEGWAPCICFPLQRIRAPDTSD